MSKFGPKIDLDNNDRGRKIWFMSDLHYNHINILQLNNRKFRGVEEMNQYILGELASKIDSNDILFDLGDLIWKESPSEIKLFSEILPPISYRVLGNHDGKNLEAWGKVWRGVYDLLDLIVKKDGEDIRITLSHFPILDWNHRYRGSWNIHGHCHGGIDSLNKESGELRLDIGFDSEISQEVGSFLIPFDRVLSEMKRRTGGKDFRGWAKNRYN